MSRQLLIQRLVIVAVLVAVVALCIAIVLHSGTTATTKVVIIGVLGGLVAGGLIAAARGSQE